ncbi:MAG: hypothetical protein M0Q16_08270 [Candidatus Cloacimonetes bacterium]|nr:hypothetical protein [Candidatus Cloacimonadota bacterium]MCK9185353.1 hypothetical protein [Candidatus Cloacimonadota bacterium]
MINEVLALKDLPAPLKKVTVKLLDDMIRVQVQTSVPFMKNLSMDARILGIELSSQKSIVHTELLGTAGNIINKLLGLLKGKIPQISVQNNGLDIDISKMLLKLIPKDAASVLDQTQVHILSLKPGYLNLEIRKT